MAQHYSSEAIDEAVAAFLAQARTADYPESTKRLVAAMGPVYLRWILGELNRDTPPEEIDASTVALVGWLFSQCVFDVAEPLRLAALIAFAQSAVVGALSALADERLGEVRPETCGHA